MISLNCVSGKALICVAIYRLQEIKLSIFLDELYDLFVFVNVLSDTVIISGDINIHQDIATNPGTIKLIEKPSETNSYQIF